MIVSDGFDSYKTRRSPNDYEDVIRYTRRPGAVRMISRLSPINYLTDEISATPKATGLLRAFLVCFLRPPASQLMHDSIQVTNEQLSDLV